MNFVDQHTKQKMEKTEQNEITNSEKQEGAPSENRLVSEVKVRNQFFNEVKKNRKRIRKSYIEHMKFGMGEYYETKPLRAKISNRRKITWVRLKN